MAKVFVTFTDSQDNGRYYAKGEDYPRLGLEVTKERLEELEEKGIVGSDQDKESLTKAEIAEELEEKGIAFNKSARKEELLKLLEQGGEPDDGDEE